MDNQKEEKPRTNKSAVASFVLGTVGLIIISSGSLVEYFPLFRRSWLGMLIYTLWNKYYLWFLISSVSLSLFGLILGRNSKKKIKTSGEKGLWVAKWGRAISAIALILCIPFVGISVLLFFAQ